jgi:hypothetical protein
MSGIRTNGRIEENRPSSRRSITSLGFVWRPAIRTSLRGSKTGWRKTSAEVLNVAGPRASKEPRDRKFRHSYPRCRLQIPRHGPKISGSGSTRRRELPRDNGLIKLAPSRTFRRPTQTRQAPGTPTSSRPGRPHGNPTLRSAYGAVCCKDFYIRPSGTILPKVSTDHLRRLTREILDAKKGRRLFLH